MIVLHISDVKNIKSNGVADVVPQFVIGQSYYAETALFDLNNVYEKNNKYKKFEGKKYSKIEDLPEKFKKPDIVVFHEVYKPRFIKLYLECKKRNIKYIIVPHGCMTCFAQNIKKIKKKIFNFLIFKRFFHEANAIQYLSELEKEKSYSHKNIIVLGNGYNLTSNQTYNINSNSNYFVYVGRYSIYHKGLDYLINACDDSKDWFRENKLTMHLYGSPESERVAIENIVKKKKIDDFVKINGPIYGEDKIKVITNSISFVQTSRFEGLPQGISEALMHGVPCIVTSGTAFMNYIDDKKCGISVKNSSNSIKDAMNKLYSDKKLRKELSQNAIKNSRNDFDWKNIGKKAIKEYEKIFK